MKHFMAIAALAFLVGCASTVGDSPAQRAFGVQSDYDGLLKVAVAYESQPRCTATVTKACSSPSVVAIIRKADLDVYPAIKAMQDTVRTPGTSTSTMNLAITGALNAVGAFRTILTNHGIGG